MRESNPPLLAENQVSCPIDERATRVRRAGVEPAKPGAGGLRPPGLSHAQPTRRCQSAPTGVEPAISRLTTGRACHQLRGGVFFEWPRWESNPQTPASEAGGFAGLPTGPLAVPGAGIEPAASWVRARRHYQQQLPRNRSALGHILTSRGSGRRIRTSTACSKGRRPAVSRSPRVPRGSRTRLSGVGGRCLGRSARGTYVRRKERESNPQGSSLARFRDGCRRQSACPSVPSAPRGGIEPPS